MFAAAKQSTATESTASDSGRQNRFLASVSVRVRVTVGFGLLILILAGVTIGAGIQTRKHQADLAKLEEHSTMSSLLQTAEAEAGISAELLQRYVYTGDDTYISEVNGHANAAQAALNEALAKGGPDGLPAVVAAGSELVQGASTTVALREAGDQAGASAEVERLAPRLPAVPPPTGGSVGR